MNMTKGLSPDSPPWVPHPPPRSSQWTAPSGRPSVGSNSPSSSPTAYHNNRRNFNFPLGELGEAGAIERKKALLDTPLRLAHRTHPEYEIVLSPRAICTKITKEIANYSVTPYLIGRGAKRVICDHSPDVPPLPDLDFSFYIKKNNTSPDFQNFLRAVESFIIKNVTKKDGAPALSNQELLAGFITKQVLINDKENLFSLFSLSFRLEFKFIWEMKRHNVTFGDGLQVKVERDEFRCFNVNRLCDLEWTKICISLVKAGECVIDHFGNPAPIYNVSSQVTTVRQLHLRILHEMTQGHNISDNDLLKTGEIIQEEMQQNPFAIDHYHRHLGNHYRVFTDSQTSSISKAGECVDFLNLILLIIKTIPQSPNEYISRFARGRIEKQIDLEKSPYDFGLKKYAKFILEKPHLANDLHNQLQGVLLYHWMKDHPNISIFPKFIYEGGSQIHFYFGIKNPHGIYYLAMNHKDPFTIIEKFLESIINLRSEELNSIFDDLSPDIHFPKMPINELIQFIAEDFENGKASAEFKQNFKITFPAKTLFQILSKNQPISVNLPYIKFSLSTETLREYLKYSYLYFLPQDLTSLVQLSCSLKNLNFAQSQTRMLLEYIQMLKRTSPPSNDNKITLDLISFILNLHTAILSGRNIENIKCLNALMKAFDAFTPLSIENWQKILIERRNLAGTLPFSKELVELNTEIVDQMCNYSFFNLTGCPTEQFFLCYRYLLHGTYLCFDYKVDPSPYFKAFDQLFAQKAFDQIPLEQPIPPNDIAHYVLIALFYSDTSGLTEEEFFEVRNLLKNSDHPVELMQILYGIASLSLIDQPSKILLFYSHDIPQCKFAYLSKINGQIPFPFIRRSTAKLVQECFESFPIFPSLNDLKTKVADKHVETLVKSQQNHLICFEINEHTDCALKNNPLNSKLIELYKNKAIDPAKIKDILLTFIRGFSNFELDDPSRYAIGAQLIESCINMGIPTNSEDHTIAISFLSQYVANCNNLSKFPIENLITFIDAIFNKLNANPNSNPDLFISLAKCFSECLPHLNSSTEHKGGELAIAFAKKSYLDVESCSDTLFALSQKIKTNSISQKLSSLALQSSSNPTLKRNHYPAALEGFADCISDKIDTVSLSERLTNLRHCVELLHLQDVVDTLNTISNQKNSAEQLINLSLRLLAKLDIERTLELIEKRKLPIAYETYLTLISYLLAQGKYDRSLLLWNKAKVIISRKQRELILSLNILTQLIECNLTKFNVQNKDCESLVQDFVKISPLIDFKSNDQIERFSAALRRLIPISLSSVESLLLPLSIESFNSTTLSPFSRFLNPHEAIEIFLDFIPLYLKQNELPADKVLSFVKALKHHIPHDSTTSTKLTPLYLLLIPKSNFDSILEISSNLSNFILSETERSSFDYAFYPKLIAFHKEDKHIRRIAGPIIKSLINNPKTKKHVVESLLPLIADDKIFLHENFTEEFVQNFLSYYINIPPQALLKEFLQILNQIEKKFAANNALIESLNTVLETVYPKIISCEQSSLLEEFANLMLQPSIKVQSESMIELSNKIDDKQLSQKILILAANQNSTDPKIKQQIFCLLLSSFCSIIFEPFDKQTSPKKIQTLLKSLILVSDEPNQAKIQHIKSTLESKPPPKLSLFFEICIKTLAEIDPVLIAAHWLSFGRIDIQSNIVLLLATIEIFLERTLPLERSKELWDLVYPQLAKDSDRYREIFLRILAIQSRLLLSSLQENKGTAKLWPEFLKQWKEISPLLPIEEIPSKIILDNVEAIISVFLKKNPHEIRALLINVDTNSENITFTRFVRPNFAYNCYLDMTQTKFSSSNCNDQTKLKAIQMIKAAIPHTPEFTEKLINYYHQFFDTSDLPLLQGLHSAVHLLLITNQANSEIQSMEETLLVKIRLYPPPESISEQTKSYLSTIAIPRMWQIFNSGKISDPEEIQLTLKWLVLHVLHIKAIDEFDVIIEKWKSSTCTDRNVHTKYLQYLAANKKELFTVETVETTCKRILTDSRTIIDAQIISYLMENFSIEDGLLIYPFILKSLKYIVSNKLVSIYSEKAVHIFNAFAVLTSPTIEESIFQEVKEDFFYYLAFIEMELSTLVNTANAKNVEESQRDIYLTLTNELGMALQPANLIKVNKTILSLEESKEPFPELCYACSEIRNSKELEDALRESKQDKAIMRNDVYGDHVPEMCRQPLYSIFSNLVSRPRKFGERCEKTYKHIDRLLVGIDEYRISHLSLRMHKDLLLQPEAKETLVIDVLNEIELNLPYFYDFANDLLFELVHALADKIIDSDNIEVILKYCKLLAILDATPQNFYTSFMSQHVIASSKKAYYYKQIYPVLPHRLKEKATIDLKLIKYFIRLLKFSQQTELVTIEIQDLQNCVQTLLQRLTGFTSLFKDFIEIKALSRIEFHELFDTVVDLVNKLNPSSIGYFSIIFADALQKKLYNPGKVYASPIGEKELCPLIKKISETLFNPVNNQFSSCILVFLNPLSLAIDNPSPEYLQTVLNRFHRAYLFFIRQFLLTGTNEFKLYLAIQATLMIHSQSHGNLVSNFYDANIHTSKYLTQIFRDLHSLLAKYAKTNQSTIEVAQFIPVETLYSELNLDYLSYLSKLEPHNNIIKLLLDEALRFYRSLDDNQLNLVLKSIENTALFDVIEQEVRTIPLAFLNAQEERLISAVKLAIGDLAQYFEATLQCLNHVFSVIPSDVKTNLSNNYIIQQRALFLKVLENALSENNKKYLERFIDNLAFQKTLQRTVLFKGIQIDAIKELASIIRRTCKGDYTVASKLNELAIKPLLAIISDMDTLT